MCTWPVVIIVSTATRLFGSWASSASRMASEMASAILSGCPSVTDSDVKRRRDTAAPGGGEGRTVASLVADRPAIGGVGALHGSVALLGRGAAAAAQDQLVAHDG